jgi:hypothetical protein
MQRFTFACLAVFLFISSIAISAEQSVKGKIKSVDVTKNSITLDDLELDDLELDVSRKTKITVDGKKGTLVDIKVGQTVDVKYDDELDAAFSITAITTPETNQTAKSEDSTTAHWKFYDPLGAGQTLEQAFVVSRDGTLISTARAKEVCLATVEEFSECTAKLEFQFPDGEVKGGPFVSVGSSRPNPDGKDFVTRFPFGIETKLAPNEAGTICLPPKGFKVQLSPNQKRDPKDSRLIFPIRAPKLKSEDWNMLEIKSDKERNLTVKINGTTVNQLMKAQSVTGHIVIWAGVSEIRIRNVVIVNENGETKLSFEDIEQ